MNEESAQSLISSLRSIPESKPTVEEKQQTQQDVNETKEVVKDKEKTAADAEKETSGGEKEVVVKEQTAQEAKKEAIGEEKDASVKEKEITVVNVKEEVIEEKETPLDTRERCWKGVINGVEFTFVVSIPSQTSCRIAIRRKGSCKRFYSPQKNEVPFMAVFRNQSVSFSVDPKSKLSVVSSTAHLVCVCASHHA